MGVGRHGRHGGSVIPSFHLTNLSHSSKQQYNKLTYTQKHKRKLLPSQGDGCVCTAEGERGRGSQMKREFLVREKREEKKINTLGFLVVLLNDPFQGQMTKLSS
jgi:hypothetical protein